MGDYLSIPALEFTHVDKKGPWCGHAHSLVIDIQRLFRCGHRRSLSIWYGKRTMVTTPNKQVLYIGNEHMWCHGTESYLRLAWWRHQMETFSALLAICAGIHRSPVNSLHKGQWHGAFMFSLICAWINLWVNNREAGDLRRYRAHYDVIVMSPWDPNYSQVNTTRAQ